MSESAGTTSARRIGIQRPRSNFTSAKIARAVIASATLVAVTGMCATATYAADDDRVFSPRGASAAPSVGGGGFANNITLVIALIMAAAGAWIFLRNRQPRTVVAGSHALAIEETKSLGNRQYLVVASYENKKFLLGVCQGRIDMLAPLHDDETKGFRS